MDIIPPAPTSIWERVHGLNHVEYLILSYLSARRTTKNWIQIPEEDWIVASCSSTTGSAVVIAGIVFLLEIGLARLQ